MDAEVFSIVLCSMISEESKSLKDILTPLSPDGKDVWRADKGFTLEMQSLVEALCDRFVRRASLFGQHRNEPDNTSKKRTRPPPMECQERDFNLAWQTLEQDSK